MKRFIVLKRHIQFSEAICNGDQQFSLKIKSFEHNSYQK